MAHHRATHRRDRAGDRRGCGSLRAAARDGAADNAPLAADAVPEPVSEQDFDEVATERDPQGTAPVQAVARIVYWFAGGSVLYAGALATRAILTGHGAVPWPWWTGGVAFVGLELLIHLLLNARGKPSLYDGRG